MLEKNTTNMQKPINSQTSTEEPVLAAPGAGIPLPQKLMMRFFVKPFVAGRTSWEISEANFHKINKKILSAMEGLTESQLTTRILVPPQMGLEDSSRYWSIKMVLEHLLIVSGQMMQLIPFLSEGIIPNEKADIAKMKPKNELTLNETVTRFKKLISTDFEQLNASIKNRASNTKFYHPWFGNMSAKQWYWLLAMHHGLHLKQLREIKKRLPLI
jgi:hypothetical protein